MNTNYDKVLLKLNGDYSIDEDLSINKPQKFYNLLEKYGSIIYNLNSREYILTSLSEVLPNKVVNKNITYLEVPSSLMSASEIKLRIKIRNMSYVYTLK